MLLNWTDQGVKNAKETVKRAAQARQLFEKSKSHMIEIYWTLGSYDLVCTAEAPDDETLTAIAIKLASLGNVKTTTLRAFNESEMEKILGKT
jgi:uncharacterized protein with GYD domain